MRRAGASGSRRDAPGKLGEVVGDHGTLRMEPLRVGGERRGMRRTRQPSTSRAVGPPRGSRLIVRGGVVYRLPLLTQVHTYRYAARPTGRLAFVV